MASPPPPASYPKAAAVMGCPVPHPKHAPDLLHCNPHPPRSHAPRSNPQPPCSCRMPNDWKSDLWFIVVVDSFIVLMALAMTCCVFLAGADYPTLKVSGLTVSNLTVTASTGATWKAAFLFEKTDFGDLSFSEVECFVHYHDAAQPLASASTEPFVLRSTDRTVIKVKITMEKSRAVIEDMHREWRSVGTVTVGLGLRMQGTYVLDSWWQRSYGRIEAYCDDVKVTLANSTGDGSLITGNNLVASNNLLSFDNLPACSYKGVDLGNTF
ncbi:hypothetical protein NL676_001909 [Syzygium grande]|nr:hypothetical protein NL676_001909 [Syzygium grande]